jgi:hydrogenase maturation protease
MKSSAIDTIARAGTAPVRSPAATAKRAVRCRAPQVVVIGYGNTLRGDDGAGPAVVARLQREFAFDPRVRFITAHQLVPEMAADLNVPFVIFVDASVELSAGAVGVKRVRAGEGQSSVTHHVGIWQVLAYAQMLHGRTPRALAFAVGVAEMELCETLSAPVEQATIALAGRLSRLIERRLCRETKPLRVPDAQRN